MRRGRRQWLRLRPRSRDDVARELDEEIALHLALRVAALVRQGLTESEARAEAVRRFGEMPGTRTDLIAAAMARERRMRVRSWLEGTRQDLVQAVRAVGREPGLSAVIVATLGLGIGANATMFGLIDRLLLRGPEHVTEPDALYRVYGTQRGNGQEFTTDVHGYALYTAVRDGTHAFDGVAAWRRVPGTVGQGSSAEPVAVGAATADFHPLVGVSASIGRFPDGAEDAPPVGEQVVTIGYDLWQRRFGGADVLGETMEVNDEPYEIIGVAPRGFTGAGLEPVDVWIPMSTASRTVTDEWPTSWDAQWLNVVVRLKDGVTQETADREVTAALRAAYKGTDDEIETATLSIRPIRYTRSGREPLEVTVSQWLLAVAALVLIIAGANVTNLLLARSMRRRREVAVRLAMGIGRGRLLRLHLGHGLVLAAGGGMAGLLIAGIIAPVARTTLLPDVQWTAGAVDSRVLLFTAVVTLAVGVLTSILPALRSQSVDLTRDLKAGVREGGGRRSILRASLVFAQVTLTFVLLVGSGLFARSLSTVRNLDLGIEPDRVLTMAVRWSAPALPEASTLEAGRTAERLRRTTFHAAALERVRQVRGIASAAVAIGTPFRSSFTVGLRASGHDTIPELPGDGPYVASVTNGFFETTGIEVLEGRSFTQADRAGSEPVAIVNRTMARTLWPQGAIDQCLYLIEGSPDAPCSRVVGVVEDARRFGLREPPAMQYYIPNGQERGFGGELLLIRPNGPIDDPRLIETLKNALLDLEPGLSYVEVGSLQQQIDPQVRPWSLGATLFSMFGGLALLIASMGLYSVIAYMVADRTHEVGVRKALGADAAAVLMLILRQGMVIVLAGLLSGVALALIAGRFIEPALFETSSRDPIVFGAVAIVTVCAALAASMIPAVRAGRVDPAWALRAE